MTSILCMPYISLTSPQMSALPTLFCFGWWCMLNSAPMMKSPLITADIRCCCSTCGLWFNTQHRDAQNTDKNTRTVSVMSQYNAIRQYRRHHLLNITLCVHTLNSHACQLSAMKIRANDVRSFVSHYRTPEHFMDLLYTH